MNSRGVRISRSRCGRWIARSSWSPETIATTLASIASATRFVGLEVLAQSRSGRGQARSPIGVQQRAGDEVELAAEREIEDPDRGRLRRAGQRGGYQDVGVRDGQRACPCAFGASTPWRPAPPDLIRHTSPSEVGLGGGGHRFEVAELLGVEIAGR